MFLANRLSIRFRLLLGGILLLILHLAFNLPQSVQISFFALGIVLTGIPHGSLDHFIYLKQENKNEKWYGLARFLLFYLGYALLYAAIWLVNIELSIAIFLLISAYHFGEMDLKDLIKSSGISAKVLSTFFGLLFLLNYLIFRWDEAKTILAGFPGFDMSEIANINAIYVYRMNFLAGSALFFMLLFLLYSLQHEIKRIDLIQTFIQLSLLALIVFNLPILLGFGFYFNCWHAVLSITEIRKALGWQDKNWLYLYKRSLPTNLAALILSISMVLYFKGDLSRMIAVLFISIAILTAPHVQVISQMFAERAKKD